MQILHDANFAKWLAIEKRKWRRLRRARAAVREQLHDARHLVTIVPALRQLGEGLLRAAILAQRSPDLLKPPAPFVSKPGGAMQ